MADIFPVNSGCKDAFDKIVTGYMASLAEKIQESVGLPPQKFYL